MINSNKIEKYDHSHRIVLYDKTDDGACVPKESAPEIASELVDSLYQARNDVWIQYREELKAGKCSPIKIFFEIHNMDVKDTALRCRISPGAVRKHFTMKGFLNMKLEVLQRYAKIFDVPVGDFFNFHFLDENLDTEVEVYHNRLFQDITIKSNSSEK